MIHAVFVGRDREIFNTLEQMLISNDVNVAWTGTGKEALDLLMESSHKDTDVVVTQEILDDMDGRELVEKVITQNPFIHCAAASSLSPKAFHDHFEGLGVLMQLPVTPDETAGAELLDQLRKVMNLTGGSTGGTERTAP